MPYSEIELNPVDFITLGTIGPKGRRTFHIQGGQQSQIVTLTLEKQQARALGEAISELLDDLAERFPASDDADPVDLNAGLRDPVDPMFRVSQIGLGYDEARDLVVIVAQELLMDEEDDLTEELQPSVVRFWGTRRQFRALSLLAERVVKKGRADPKSNGRLIYYWT